MTADNRFVAVIGGVNIDIGGRSDAPLVARDSNPGRVTTSLGGVGRNIAHNLALLGVRVRFLTALGDDAYAREICHSCGELGVDLSLSLTVLHSATSTYLYLEDCSGDLALAVTDTRLCDHITPQYIASHMDEINAAAVVFADANLRADTLAYLATHCSAPLIADPVSTAKAGKLLPILGHLHSVKPNRLEAELLSGVAIRDEESLRQATKTMLDTGLKRVFITLGAKGVYAAERGKEVFLPTKATEIRSANGAGDAFTAALGRACLDGLDLESTCRLASAAAAIALESETAINPALCTQKLYAELNDHCETKEKPHEPLS